MLYCTQSSQQTHVGTGTRVVQAQRPSHYWSMTSMSRLKTAPLFLPRTSLVLWKQAWFSKSRGCQSCGCVPWNHLSLMPWGSRWGDQLCLHGPCLTGCQKDWEGSGGSLRLFVLVSGFHGSPVGKEFACNVGDPDSIPKLGRSAGEGIGHPLQYCWVSLVAQLVRSLPAMRETWDWSLGWEDPLEKGTHSSILDWI